MNTGSAKKYLLYATGEILLVMIGILLALQVNNWNEWNKERDKEREVLQNMTETLRANIELISYHENSIRTYERSGQIIVELMNSSKLQGDTLGRHFHFAFVNGASDVWLSESGYEYLNETNGDIIHNRQLRKEIIQLFESSYKYLFQELSWGLKDDPETHEFLDQNFQRTQDAKLVPYNVNDLYQNRIFNSLLKKALAQRYYILNLLNRNKEETQKVLSNINRELQKH